MVPVTIGGQETAAFTLDKNQCERLIEYLKFQLPRLK
jgi:hypothetical protein